MRRVATLIGGVAIVASLLAAPVSAAPPQRISDTESVLFCEELTNADGVVFLFAVESEQFGSFADLAFWPDGSTPATDPPAWITLTGSADFTASSVTASFDLVEYDPAGEDPFGDPVGTATLSATLTPVGEPQEYQFQDHFGNQLTRREGVFQEYSVAGTLSLPTGISFDLGTCGAVTDSYTMFANSPAAFVGRFEQMTLDCFWTVDDTFIGLFGFADDFGGFADLFISGPDTEIQGVPDGPVTFTTDAFDASFALFDLADPSAEEPVGSATASATLTEGGRINERYREPGGYKSFVRGTQYLVDGTLSIDLGGAPLELPMDDASCFAADVTITDIITPSRGPRGRPLPNEGPETAEPIAIGETVTVRTGGTDPAPEAACLQEFEGDVFEIPFGHTAWWSFEGTGGDVTVDTAGSDFDTVIGIYTDSGGGLEQVVCVDDTEAGLQASATIPTEAGVTYYVQAGGFGGATGSLVLSVE